MSTPQEAHAWRLALLYTTGDPGLHDHFDEDVGDCPYRWRLIARELASALATQLVLDKGRTRAITFLTTLCASNTTTPKGTA
jgi:hypothetical protein